MPFYPSNRVKNNLYTPGAEFIDLVTNKEYVGYYHELYTGKCFSGQTPYVENNHPLQRIKNKNSSLVDSDKLNVIGGRAVNTTTLTATTVTQNPNQYASRKIPVYYYPQPTQQNYAIGEFIRYFAKKVNQNVFIEINENTYNALVSQDENYVWENYIAISLPWLILGTPEQVAAQNKKITRYVEISQKVFGLGIYLKENYTEFLQT